MADARFNLNKDNSGRLLHFEIKEPATGSQTITPNASYTYVHIDDLAGDITITLDAADSMFADHIIFIFSEPATDASPSVVTFAGDVVSSGTLSVSDGGNGTATFVFDGTNFVETGRASM